MQKLIRELSKLPSIGEKSAARLAYHLVNGNRTLADNLSKAISEAAESIRLCEKCHFITDQPLCTICRNHSRDASLLCVVEKPTDVVAIERVGEYRGYFHVLHGLWAPLRGQGPESMKLEELIDRVKKSHSEKELTAIDEVILATGATVEGDATALYIARLMDELGVKTSRLAQGIPKGGELEYADEVTLSRAFAGRSRLNL